MQTNKKKSSKPIAPVKKPFLKGAPLDHTCGKSILLMVGATLAVMVGMAFGSIFMFDNAILRYALNIMLLAAVYSMFYYSGTSRGTMGVNQGEILYKRREQGLSVDEKELTTCYHPLKGLLIGLLGSIPVILCALMLAILAKKQMTSYGYLPSWVSGLAQSEEIGAPLQHYLQAGSLTLESVLRIIVRLNIIPFINMVGTENTDMLLMVERVSPLIVMLPAVAYGIGYTRGESVRSRVHTDIAVNTMKRKKKTQKQIRQRRNKMNQQRKGPEQLN